MRPPRRSVMPATSRILHVGSHKTLMDQIGDPGVAHPALAECDCGHPREEHQGEDESGAGLVCSVWDCECEFFAGEESPSSGPSILSAGAGKLNHTIVVPYVEEDVSR